MQQKDIDFAILARYMAGDTTPQEREYIQTWANRTKENAEKLRFFRKLWKRSQPYKENGSLPIVEEEWERFSRRIGKEEVERRKEKQGSSNLRRFSGIHSGGQQFIRTAAIALIAAMLGFFSYRQLYNPTPEPKEPVFREVSTDTGQRVNMTMEDGSRVMLNAESSLELPTEFEEDVREVYLNGEAYFEVAEDVERPFLVHSQGAVVRVLGTAFVIRSYPEDEDVRVVVSEGKVSFGVDDEQALDETILNPDQMGRYNLDSKTIRKENVNDLQLYLSWREGYLKFQDEDMAQVATELKRRYDIDVSFADPDIEKKRLTAYLKSRSLTNVLDIIAKSVDVEYSVKNDTVEFLNK